MRQSTIDKFITHGHTLINLIFDRKNFVESEIDGDTAVLTYVFPKPLNIYDLLDELDDNMEMVIAYHVVPTHATVHGEQCCAYSDPTIEFIYKVNGITDDSGMCDTIYVTLYDSLDELGFDVLAEMQEQMKNNNEVVFTRPLREVVRDFMR
jgi:gamma-glutamylcyclotransferase (GGCT)/AIG2-like uncharacterized protein YtfP